MRGPRATSGTLLWSKLSAQPKSQHQCLLPETIKLSPDWIWEILLWSLQRRGMKKRILRRRLGGGEGKTKHQQQQSFSGMFFVCKWLPGLMINTMMQSIQIAFGLHQTDFYRHYWQVSFISYTSLRIYQALRLFARGILCAVRPKSCQGVAME